RLESLIEDGLDRTGSALELWTGRIPVWRPDRLPLGKVDSNGSTRGSDADSEEMTLRVLRIAAVNGTSCRPGRSASHLFLIAPPLRSNMADGAVCRRCGLEALIAPGGRTLALGIPAR